jgi:hypothetical protein
VIIKEENISQNKIPIIAPIIQIKKGLLTFFTLVNKLGNANAINKDIVSTKCTEKGAPLDNIGIIDNTKKVIAIRTTFFNLYTL